MEWTIEPLLAYTGEKCKIEHLRCKGLRLEQEAQQALRMARGVNGWVKPGHSTMPLIPNGSLKINKVTIEEIQNRIG